MRKYGKKIGKIRQATNLATNTFFVYFTVHWRAGHGGEKFAAIIPVFSASNNVTIT